MAPKRLLFQGTVRKSCARQCVQRASDLRNGMEKVSEGDLENAHQEAWQKRNKDRMTVPEKQFQHCNV